LEKSQSRFKKSPKIDLKSPIAYQKRPIFCHESPLFFQRALLGGEMVFVKKESKNVALFDRKK